MPAKREPTRIGFPFGYDVAMTPTEDQIDEQLNLAAAQEEEGGSKWPGMSYEQGVRAAIDWMRGFADEPPMADD